MYDASLIAISPVVWLYTQPAPPEVVVGGDAADATTVELPAFAPTAGEGKLPRKYVAKAVGNVAVVGYPVLFTRYVSIAVRSTDNDCNEPFNLAVSVWLTNFGKATAAKIPKIKTTTINSTNVNAPRSLLV
jgi:hypothetical protein